MISKAAKPAAPKGAALILSGIQARQDFPGSRKGGRSRPFWQ